MQCLPEAASGSPNVVTTRSPDCPTFADIPAALLSAVTQRRASQLGTPLPPGRLAPVVGDWVNTGCLPLSYFPQRQGTALPPTVFQNEQLQRIHESNVITRRKTQTRMQSRSREASRRARLNQGHRRAGSRGLDAPLLVLPVKAVEQT